MPFPPPVPTPLPPVRHGRRRWPWVALVVGLAVALVVAGTVVLTRDDTEATVSSDIIERADALLREPGAGQEGASGDGAPSTPAPSSEASPLDDLLEGLGGASGLGGTDIDPTCLVGEGGTPNLLGRGIEGTVDEQVAEIARLVEEERGLRFERAVEPELLGAAAFDERIAELVRAEYPVEQADLDSRVLQLLGAVPKGTDLKALQEDLMSGQVAGYYDPDTGQVVVRVPGGGDSLDTNGQITLAHELDHALTDQALGLPDIDQRGASDSNLARLGLVEGDATLVMQRFSLQSVGLLDQLGAALGPDALAAQQDLADVPAYLRNELIFPYTAGLAYACRLDAAGGWSTVDAAYRDLPATTAEILFAERAGLAPVEPDDIAPPGGAWDEARRDSFGAAPLLWLLQAPGGDEDRAVAGAEDAARAWAGGDVALFVDGARSALGLALVDDGEAGALCQAVEEWYVAAFDASSTPSGDDLVLEGGDQVGVLRCEGADVRLGIAPDQATAAALAA